MPDRRRGRFLGLPYDFRRPSADRLRSRAWNTDNPSPLTPKTYGWGYGLNLGAPVAWVRAVLRLVKRAR